MFMRSCISPFLLWTWTSEQWTTLQKSMTQRAGRFQTDSRSIVRCEGKPTILGAMKLKQGLSPEGQRSAKAVPRFWKRLKTPSDASGANDNISAGRHVFSSIFF